MRLNRLVTGTIITLLSAPGLAASSNLSQVESLSSGIDAIDLTVSFDKKFTQANRQYIENSIHEFNEHYYKMTEGQQYIRTVYVYDDGDKVNSADIQLKDKPGRSNANGSGFKRSGGRMLVFTHTNSGQKRSEAFLGQTLAHEAGHYMLGIYDEYTGSNATAKYPSAPLSSDVARNTMMNAHWRFTRLSADEDYPNKLSADTAQIRTYEDSAWTVISRPNTKDKKYNSLKVYPKRHEYSSLLSHTTPLKFADITSPNLPTTLKTKVIFVDNTFDMLVLDISGSMRGTGMESLANAALQYLDLKEIGDVVGITTFDSYANTVVQPVVIDSEDTRTYLKGVISGLYAGGGTNFQSAFDEVQTVFENLPIESDLSVIFMSDGQSSKPDVSYFTENDIPIHTVGLGDYVDSFVLNEIANEAEGQSLASGTSQELADAFRDLEFLQSGDSVIIFDSEVNLEEVVNIPLESESNNFQIKVLNTDIESLSVELRSPDGQLVVESDNVRLTKADEYLAYTFSDAAAGTYSLIVSSSDPQLEIASTNVSATAVSSLTVSLTVKQDSVYQPATLTALVNGENVVIGADVEVLVFDSEKQLLTTVVLVDDGTGTDLLPNDGTYTAVLPDQYSGSLTFKVKVDGEGSQYSMAFGEAVEDGMPEENTVIAPFARAASANAEILTAPMLTNTDVDSAVAIEATGAVYHGLYEGADLYYRLTVDDEQQYPLYVRTSQLLGTEALETTIEIYSPDGTELLTSSTGYNDTQIALAELTEPLFGEYIVVVRGNEPKFNFGLSADTSTQYTEIQEVYEAPKTDGGSSNGGGLNPLFLLVILIGRSVLRKNK